MKKGSKVLGIFLFILAALCIGMYFVYNMMFSSYTVTFDSDGGTQISAQTVKRGEKATEPEIPLRENSEFLGWQLDGQAYSFDTAVTSNITLKALWNVIDMHTIKVTIDGNEYTTTIRNGSVFAIEALNIPEKEGYRIKLYDAAGNEYSTSNIVNEDIVLTGKYIEIKKYTVKFDSNGGSKVTEVKVNEGDLVAEPTVTRDGYKLDGWYLGEQKYDFQTPVTMNMTLKARWNDGTKYTVTYNVDNKTYKTDQVKENTKATKPANPTKKGYKFIEWQLNGSAFDFNTKITENITLEAKFEEASTYTVTFNSDGGSSVKSQEVTDKATKPTNPTKSGYTFVEWQLNGKTYDFNKEVVEDITLKAKWEKEITKYTVTFNTNGGSSIDKQTVKEGDKATKPANPTKEGYTFEEWLYNNQTYDFEKPVTQSITLTARYKAVSSTPDIPDVPSESNDEEDK